MAQRHQQFMERGQDAASLTIPYIAPPDGHNQHTDYSGYSLPTPFQSVGSRGINNVAAKFLLTLLPPAAPFFRLGLNHFAYAREYGSDGITEAEQGLVQMENAVSTEIEMMGIRPVAYQAFRHLSVVGNGCLYVPDEGSPKFYPLSQYRCRRDPSDNVELLVIREEIAFNALPKATQKKVILDDILTGDSGSNHAGSRNVILYTVTKLREDGRYDGYQELESGTVLEDSRGVWDDDELPYIVLRWNRIDGEDYGRGLAEEHMGDLRTLEGLTQALVDGAAAAAHHIWLVNPNGRTRIRDVQNAPTGAFRSGVPEDVQALRMEKGNDFSFAAGMAQDVQRRLEHAFLLITSIQRHAERVTAEEIRTLSNELEANLGGVFSVQADEFQMPLVRRVMRRMQRVGALPTLPAGVVEPRIITGIEGLSRAQELNRLRVGIRDIVENLGPEAVNELMDRREVADRFLNGAGVTSEGLLLSQEDIHALQQAAQQQQMVSDLGPTALTELGKATANQQAPS
jgi:hypothetical protein